MSGVLLFSVFFKLNSGVFLHNTVATLVFRRIRNKMVYLNW